MDDQPPPYPSNVVQADVNGLPEATTSAEPENATATVVVVEESVVAEAEKPKDEVEEEKPKEQK